MPRFEGTDACADVRDVLPLRGTEAWHPVWSVPVDAHLVRCDACRREAAFVHLLRGASPEPPAGLVEAVLDGVRTRRDEKRRQLRWMSPAGLSAAAAAVLVLGLGFLWDREPRMDGLWEMVLEPDAPSWYGDEWMVAGGPVPEALSDDVLLLLAQEMDP